MTETKKKKKTVKIRFSIKNLKYFKYLIYFLIFFIIVRSIEIIFGKM